MIPLQTENKTKNLYDLNLREQDPYTCRTFEELQQERFTANCDYHICMVNQNDRTYLFDASQFIEDCVLSKKIVANPCTRKPIEDFKIFVSSKKDPDFQLHMTKDEVLTPPQHIPILWNDSARSQQDRISLMLDYGNIIEEKEANKAIDAYQRAIKLGSSLAKFNLGALYKKLGIHDLSLKFLKESLEEKCIGIWDSFFCAGVFDKSHDYNIAFKGYQLAADQGNAYGIGEVIRRLELGLGTKKDLLLAKHWREKLPKEWQEGSIADFFHHLKEINYGYDQQGYP